MVNLRVINDYGEFMRGIKITVVNLGVQIYRGNLLG